MCDHNDNLNPYAADTFITLQDLMVNVLVIADPSK